MYFDVSKPLPLPVSVPPTDTNEQTREKTTRKTGMNVEKFGINVVIYGTKMWCFFGTFYDYNLFS